MVDAETLEAEVVSQVLGFSRNPALRERVETAARAAAEKATARAAKDIFLLRMEIGRLTGICDWLFRDHYESGIISREQFSAKNAAVLSAANSSSIPSIRLKAACTSARPATAATVFCRLLPILAGLPSWPCPAGLSRL